MPKNGVMNGVIHFIHKKQEETGRISTGKREQMFCEEAIKMTRNPDFSKKVLTLE